MRGSKRARGTAALALWLAACSGSVDTREPGPGAGGESGTTTPGGIKPGGGSTGGGRGEDGAGTLPAGGSAGGKTGPGAGSTPASCAKGAALGPSPLRRLTNAEYARTVRDLLALPATAELGVALADEGSVDGFINNTAVQTLTAKHLDGYVGGAERLAAALLADPKRRDAVFGCAPTGAGRDACVRSFVTKFGRRAFRRPLTAAEVDQYAAFAAASASDPDPYAGLEQVLAAMLASPSFLFLVETGAPDPQRPGLVRLAGHELATRLSLVVWGRGPSEALLDAAAAGKLDTPAGLAATAKEMLADPRAREAQRDFFAGWLGLAQLAQVAPDAKRYPAFGEPLRAAFEEETLRFLDELGSRPTGSFLELVTADWTFVNAALAKHYGLPAPASGWAKATFPAGQRGAGLLTQGAVLTMTAPHEGVEPIKRGQFVRQSLLCQKLPPPPADVPALDQAKAAPNATERERLAAHQSNPSCSGCHQLLDPIGFGLSGYDGIGAARTKDPKGNPIDVKGSISGFAKPEFEGPRALGAALAAAPEVPRCVATQLFRYAAARTETADDACAVGALDEAFRAGGYAFGPLVQAMVASDAFRYRRIPTQAGGTP